MREAMTDDDKIRDLLVSLINEVRAPRISFSVADAERLVMWALRHEEISMGKAAELLGLRADEMRARAGETQGGET